MGRQTRRYRRRNQRHHYRRGRDVPIELTLAERPTDHEAFPGEGVFGVDANGCLTETVMLGGDPVIHYDDVPDHDLTEVDGIPCTTALRTIIDLAVELTDEELLRIVDDALQRNLFTLAEAWERLSEADMAHRRGAEILRQRLPPVP